LASILEKSQGYHVTVKGKERYLVQLLYGKEGTLTTKENCALQFVKIQKKQIENSATTTHISSALHDQCLLAAAYHLLNRGVRSDARANHADQYDSYAQRDLQNRKKREVTSII
jgi:hypothetical protein